MYTDKWLVGECGDGSNGPEKLFLCTNFGAERSQSTCPQNAPGFVSPTPQLGKLKTTAQSLGLQPPQFRSPMHVRWQSHVMSRAVWYFGDSRLVIARGVFLGLDIGGIGAKERPM